jgi:hypothetical protein
MCWKEKISPFAVTRLLGAAAAYDLFKGFIERKYVPVGGVL